MLKLELFTASRRIDIIAIICLGAVSFMVTSFFLESYGQTMIYFDAYQNFQDAISTAEGKVTTSFSPATQAPFLLYLSLLYRFFSDPATALLPLRIINLCLTVQLVIFFYLIARKMFNVFFSLVGALMALFLPLVMAYSGTLHSDIFATAMGFTSLYFSIKPQRMLHVALATTFIIWTSARLDTLIVFLIPYFIGLVYYIQLKTHVRFSVLFAIVLTIFFVPFYFGVQSTSSGLYHENLFHHNVIEQVFSLVRFDTLNTVLHSSVEITGEKALSIKGYEGLNELYVSIIFIGIIFFVFNYRKTIYKILVTMKYRFSEAGTTVIYLVIATVASLIILTAFHIQINPKDFTIINEILPRYTITMRLFLLFGFIYGLSLASTAYRIVTYLVTKNKADSNYGKLLTRRQNDVAARSLEDIAAQSTMKTRYMISTCASYVFVLFVITLFLVAMWDSAIRFYELHSVVTEAYHQATQWVSAHLGKNEMAFLPLPNVFWSFDPTLKNRTYAYESIWDSSGIPDRITTTNEQKLEVSQHLKDFVDNDTNKIRYLVLDLTDEYFVDMSGITNFDLIHGVACEKFDQKLNEAKQFNFILPESGWESVVVICEVNKIAG